MNFKKELGKMRKSLSYLVAAATLSFGAPAFAADSELVVFDWGGYEDEMFFQDYMKKYGDAPTYSFFSDEEEAFQKQSLILSEQNPAVPRGAGIK